MQLISKSISSVAIISGGLVLLLVSAGIVFFLNERTVAQQHAKTSLEQSLIGRAVTEQDHTIGAVSAPIQVIVYSELDCKYCKNFFTFDVPKLQARFGSSIVFAYRHLPLPSHPTVLIKEEASECVYAVGGNDAFWKFITIMYALPLDSPMNVDQLSKVSIRSGVSAATFKECMARGDGKEQVAQDRLEASIAGMNVTPSFLLKSEHRALIVSGQYYSQIYAGILYLLTANTQINTQK